MFRKTTFSVCILILLVSCVGFGFQFASSVGAATTWTVDDAGPADFSTIQEAVDAASDGDTVFVKTGIYYEHVVVNRTVSLVGEDSSTTIIDGNGTGRVIDIISDHVNVTGFTVQRGGSISLPDLDAGICLNSITDCTISENCLVGNGFAGISLLNSQRNTIAGNTVTGTGWGGIHLLDSSNNTISGNILDSNIYVGINGHASSHYNNIHENVISNSTYGMFYHNANYNNIFRNNISDIAVEGIWLQDQVNYNIVAENALTNCSVGIKLLGPNYNNIVSGNILTDGQCGIRIQNARYTEIHNNTIAHNYGGEWDAGIRLDAAGYSRIHSNLIVDNWRGILLYTTSPHVSIYSNNITDNEFAIRVASGGSNYLNVSDNIVMNNRGYGIGMTGFGGASNYATISRNLIVNNSDGITLGQFSNYNTILQNNISQNGYGFYIDYSTQNTIRGNNIVDNDQQVYVSTGSVNNWDGGYPTGGNYWSDYAGTDLNSGSYQNITGSDGIGDTLYIIDDNNTDHYPLMVPWAPELLKADLNDDGVVNILDISIVAIAFGSTPEDSNWNIIADLNNDQIINILDVSTVALEFGKTV
jgi:parallel beta-helix repeat protein